MLKLNFRKIVPHAFDPEYSTEDAAGLDIRAIYSRYDVENNFIEYDTGLAFEIPSGHVGLLVARSSSTKTPHILANCVGILDPDYRGEVKFRFKNINIEDKDYIAYEFGDKIGQLVVVPCPKISLEEKVQLEDTKRGSGGFGSTGR
jgi:dUTP pyrophosphatase